MVEDGDAEVSGKLAFYESGVGVGKQKSEQHKNEDAHRFVGQDAEEASVQGQLLHFLMAQNITDGNSRNSSQQLRRNVAEHHLRLVLAFLLEAVGKRDDWVDVRPAQTAANSNRDQQQTCSLHVVPHTSNRAQVPERKEEDCQTLEHKELQTRRLVHDAELVVLEPAERALLETLRSLELVLELLIEQGAIDFLFEGHTSEIQVDYQGMSAILVSFQLEFDAMQQGLALLLLAGETGEEVKSFVGLFGVSCWRHCAWRICYSVVDVLVDSVLFIRSWSLRSFLRFLLGGSRYGEYLGSVSSHRRLLSVCNVSQ